MILYFNVLKQEYASARFALEDFPEAHGSARVDGVGPLITAQTNQRSVHVFPEVSPTIAASIVPACMVCWHGPKPNGPGVPCTTCI